MNNIKFNEEEKQKLEENIEQMVKWIKRKQTDLKQKVRINFKSKQFYDFDLSIDNALCKIHKNEEEVCFNEYCIKDIDSICAFRLLIHWESIKFAIIETVKIHWKTIKATIVQTTDENEILEKFNEELKKETLYNFQV